MFLGLGCIDCIESRLSGLRVKGLRVYGVWGLGFIEFRT